MVERIIVEKRKGFDIPAQRVLHDIVHVLKIDAEELRMFLIYDIEGVDEGDMPAVVDNVFSEPPCDLVYHEKLPWLFGYKVFGTEYLKGQYDQRADSAEQCVQLLLNKERPRVMTTTVYAIKGINNEQLKRIQTYLINPTDSRLSTLEKLTTLEAVYEDNDAIEFVDEFIAMPKAILNKFHANGGFAMSFEDMVFVQNHFKDKKRNPTVTELKVIDTYWSDHCRHTTFLTHLEDVGLGANRELIESFRLYRRLFRELYKDRPDKYVCLMDIATIAAKDAKARGLVKDLDESDEINACSIKVKAKIGKKTENWLVMFKNETHNHPTEIEPFGGAATCLGGAIRDPLSGRVYVYQAMRITGAGDVFQDVKDTRKGKLPQRVISKTATAGFSSYGNQIGLATGIVNEVYHDKYVAKRLETGFVIGAAPQENVVRKKPAKRDKIILLGGETGRDGCGGATGSSKAHTEDSVTTCGAEVQKGNALTERKIQRFFRNPEATTLIKKCNDFGAGGVAVAIGELADGLDIHLDRVPKKYKGLSVTETAISESQERMAVVVADENVNKFLKLVAEENLQATVVAEVTGLGRMRMFNKGNLVVDLDRAFLDTNGVKQTANVFCRDFKREGLFETYQPAVKEALVAGDPIAALRAHLTDKNVMLQKGQGETFDSTIGRATVLMPFGGKYQLTPSLVMAAKLPVREGFTNTSSVCSWAFDPHITDENPYFGGLYATLASVVKLVVAGVEPNRIRLTLQEFFKRLNGDPERFGEPFAALLGALQTQYELGTPAIGGKDSMSGSFEELDVPNTLISFAAGIAEAEDITTNVFEEGMHIFRIPLTKGKDLMPDFDRIKMLFRSLRKETKNGNVLAATVVEAGGAVAAAVKSAVGNHLGLTFKRLRDVHFESRLGDVLVAVNDIKPFLKYKPEYFAYTRADGLLTVEVYGELKKKEVDALELFLLPENSDIVDKTRPVYDTIAKEEVLKLLSGHDAVYPSTHEVEPKPAQNIISDKLYLFPKNKLKVAKPRVLIPVFPGTNCEYDTAIRFEEEGAKTNILVLKNGSAAEIEESVARLVKAIGEAQIIAFPGGFSGGDEPDGSGKFIAATFRNPQIQEMMERHFADRDGLAIGICNGFQALIKLGLLPFGQIAPMREDSPTLTYNAINRHVSTVVKVRVATTASPWLSSFQVGDVFAVPVSHGEGRFTATEKEFKKILRGGQIATQYVDDNNMATMKSPANPNGSLYAVEGLISTNGRVLGKMGHSERYQEGLYKNLPKEWDFNMNLFANGVKYYK